MAKKTSRREALKKFIAEWITTYNKDAILMDGMENAFIGVSYSPLSPFDTHARALYDTTKCIEAIQLREDCDLQSAKTIFESEAYVLCFRADSNSPQNTPMFFDKFTAPSLKNDWLGL